MNTPSIRQYVVRSAARFPQSHQPDRIQPDNWRNIGTKYQHDDSDNQMVTQPRSDAEWVGIDNNPHQQPILAFGCQGQMSRFSPPISADTGMAIVEWYNGYRSGVSDEYAPPRHTIELWYRGKTKVMTSPGLAKTRLEHDSQRR